LETKIDIYKYARNKKLLGSSALRDKEFREFFKSTKINRAVEIGTFKGLSTAYIAQFANKVYTFDVVDFKIKYKVWTDLNVNKKIKFYHIKNRDAVKNKFTVFSKEYTMTGREVELETVLGGLGFDFAFVDGKHTYEGVKNDFELVKNCGRVLFHDLNNHIIEVKKFAKEINATITGNIAYWEGS
jgi:predicted O-methyltransferase YrrM